MESDFKGKNSILTRFLNSIVFVRLSPLFDYPGNNYFALASLHVQTILCVRKRHPEILSGAWDYTQQRILGHL